MADRTTRLDVAKETLQRFLESRADDIGIVSFAGEALTRLPLTADSYVTRAAVDALEVGLLVDGTDVAGAIAAGLMLGASFGLILEGSEYGTWQTIVGAGIGARWLRSANIPASETKPGETAETPTPLPRSSERTALAHAMRPAFVAA